MLGAHISWIGTLPGWLTIVALAIVGWYFVRGQGGQALSILEQANRVLRGRIDELEHERVADRQKIAELEATRSLEAIGEQITAAFAEQQEKAEHRLRLIMTWATNHEQHAQERHDQQLEVTREVGLATVKALDRVADGAGQ